MRALVTAHMFCISNHSGCLCVCLHRRRFSVHELRRGQLLGSWCVLPFSAILFSRSPAHMFQVSAHKRVHARTTESESATEMLRARTRERSDREREVGGSGMRCRERT